MSVRIGVLGTGAHSRATHGPALREIVRRSPGGVELAAVCDLEAEKARDYASEFGFERAYSDIDEMLGREDLDGLIAVTPVKLTEKIVSALLPRGFPLLIEKPPGETPEATQRLAALAERYGTPHMISFNRRFSPVIVKARQWIEEGGGERRPKMILGRMLRHARREEHFAAGTGIHLVDTVVSLLGAPESIGTVRIPTAQAGSFLFYAHANYRNERTALFAIAPAVGALEETLEIHGQDYCLKVDVRGQRVALWQEKEEVWQWAVPASADREIRDVIAETGAFLSAIEGKQLYWPTLTDAVVSMRVAEAIQKGGTVAFD